MYVVVTGNAIEGMEVRGPFEVPDDAVAYAELNYRGEEWAVAEVKAEVR